MSAVLSLFTFSVATTSVLGMVGSVRQYETPVSVVLQKVPPGQENRWSLHALALGNGEQPYLSPTLSGWSFILEGVSSWPRQV